MERTLDNGGVVVGDDVNITIDAEMIKQVPENPVTDDPASAEVGRARVVETHRPLPLNHRITECRRKG